MGLKTDIIKEINKDGSLDRLQLKEMEEFHIKHGDKEILDDNERFAYCKSCKNFGGFYYKNIREWPYCKAKKPSSFNSFFFSKALIYHVNSFNECDSYSEKIIHTIIAKIKRGLRLI